MEGARERIDLGTSQREIRSTHDHASRQRHWRGNDLPEVIAALESDRFGRSVPVFDPFSIAERQQVRRIGKRIHA